MNTLKARSHPRPTGKSRPRPSSVGRRLIAALMEVSDALDSGEPLEARFTVRTYDVPDPGAYDAASVKRVRDRVGASQALFALVLGVSVNLVQAWEQGHRRPSPLARRLLDEIARDPGRWAEIMKPR